MRQQYARRTQLIIAIMGFVAFAIIFQMVRIQNSSQAPDFLGLGDGFQYEWKTVFPDRGEIYDRNGHLLAGNKTVYEITVDLNTVKSPETIASTLSRELGSDYAMVLDQIQNPDPGIVSVTVANPVDQQDGLRLVELTNNDVTGDLRGLNFIKHPKRSYPENSLASNVIGYVNGDGLGYFGVEEKYNNILAGNAVPVAVPVDPNKVSEIPHIPNGTTLILTLNRDLQASAEKILDDAISKYGATRGTIVIMDPQTGELLTMASTRRMNLNQIWDYGSTFDNASDYNPAISIPYEPGSVLKILTMAAALDSGTVTPGTTYMDTGVIYVGGVPIQNWDRNPWGIQDMTGCLQHSLNVCMATLSTSMGATTFYSYMDKFGLGHLTGVDMGGEAAGRLKIPGDGDWYPVDLGTNAFGQGVAVTPIQIMTAASAIANHGNSVTPHVLYATVRHERQYKSDAVFSGSPISAQTADTLNEMLANSLEFEGSMALVEGYRIAGKTGTAQIPGEYETDATNASFIGWGPVDDPKFMIYVWLERPTASIWGSETAAPVFAQMAEKTILLLNIPPDSVRKQIAQQ
ncbi:MAG: penicillin-binding protein 2 [Chloroflexi bacterium]|nr:penicillin-binding protein 2 [Chloroflexota bacterium]